MTRLRSKVIDGSDDASFKSSFIWESGFRGFRVSESVNIDDIVSVLACVGRRLARVRLWL
jgi:hypothetical protein